MDLFEPSRADFNEIDELIALIAQRYGDSSSEAFVNDAPVLAHELPRGVRSVLNDFRLEDLSGSLIVSGLKIDQDKLGNTPTHWCQRPQPSPALREEILLVLYASLLGEPFAWVTQQDGRLIHDVLPIEGHEHEQIGSSSQTLLTWHTEDAFHPLRGDYLILACLRNPSRAATTVASVNDLQLSDKLRSILAEERFYIFPDESHLSHNNSPAKGIDFSSIEQLRSKPSLIAVLFGDLEHPYIRADPYFMSVESGDDEAQMALDELVEAIDRCLMDVSLAPGDYCLLDNYRVVHGRKPFRPAYDGSDRWLKRINVTRDLRRSRAVRASATCRSVH